MGRRLDHLLSKNVHGDLGDSYQRWLDTTYDRARLRDMIARPWHYDDPIDDTERDHPELHPGVSVPCADTEVER